MSNYNRNRNSNPQMQQPKTQTTYKPLDSETYVNDAEAVIMALTGKGITSNQLRKYGAMMATIYNQVVREKDEFVSSEIKDQLQYLRVQLVYAAGREASVKEFFEKANLIEHVRANAHQGNRARVILLYHYMEALIAWHKFYNKG